jgi:cell division protein FtsW
VVIGAFALMITTDWRREQFFCLPRPWTTEYSMGKGYQLSHSLIAFGRGEKYLA